MNLREQAESDIPDWLPPGSKPALEGKWWVVEAKTATLALGKVPDNGRIEIHMTRPTILTVTAESVRSKAKIRIVPDKGNGCVLKAKFRHVEMRELDKPTRQFGLTINGRTKLRTHAGHWKLDSGDPQATVEVIGGSEVETQVSGRAKISLIDWTGPLRLYATPIEGSTVSTTGNLDVRSTLRKIEVNAKAVKAAAIHGGAVRVEDTLVANELSNLAVHAGGDVTVNNKASKLKIKSDGNLRVGPVVNNRSVVDGLSASIAGNLTASALKNVEELAVEGLTTCDSIHLAPEGPCIHLKEVATGTASLARRRVNVTSLRAATVSEEGARVEAETISLTSEWSGSGRIDCASFKASALTAHEIRCGHLELEGPLIVSKADLRGDGVFGCPPVEAEIHWSPTGGNKITVGDGKLNVHIDSSGSEPNCVEIQPHGQVGLIVLNGRIELTGLLSADLYVDSLELTSANSSIVAKSNLVISRLTAPGASAEVVAYEGTTSVSMSLQPPVKEVTLNGAKTCTFTVDIQNGIQPKLFVAEARTVIRSGHSIAPVFGLGPSAPILELGEDALAEEASGQIRIGRIDGRLSSDPSNRLRILGVEADGAGMGQLFGADPTSIPLRQIGNLKELYVFEPAAAPIQKFAEGALGEFEIRERAQWIRQLDEAMSPRAQSGRTRASIKWAAARLQHRSLTGLSGERLGRSVHRLLGYSYLPQWPAFWWLMMALFVPLFSSRRCWSPGDAECALQPGGYFSDVLKAMFFPFRVLRITSEDSAFEGLHELLVPIAGVLIGVPFLFTVLALKNYLYSPADKG